MGPLSFTRHTVRKDTVICFTYFLISFFFSHLVILPSFSRRKLKWKEKVEPMFYTNSSCESSSTFCVLQPVCRYYRRTNFFVWCSYFCSLFGSLMWTCVINRSDPLFPKPTLPQRRSPLICAFKHTISRLSISLILSHISKYWDHAESHRLVLSPVDISRVRKYVMTFDMLLLCVSVNLKLCQICSKQLNSWTRVILEKLIVPQMVKKFPILYGTQRVISVFTSVSHWFVFRATLFQSTTSHPVSSRVSLVLSSCLYRLFQVVSFLHISHQNSVLLSVLSNRSCMI